MMKNNSVLTTATQTLREPSPPPRMREPRCPGGNGARGSIPGTPGVAEVSPAE
jgi:hypothetical protein